MNYEIINERKRQLGITNSQLSEITGISISTLDKITAGKKNNPTLDTMQAIADAIGCSIDDFRDIPSKPLSAKATEVARAYDIMSDYGRAIIDLVVAQEENRRKESLGKPKILCGGMKYVPIGTPDGFKVLNQTGAVEIKEAAKRELSQEEDTLNPQNT